MTGTSFHTISPDRYVPYGEFLAGVLLVIGGTVAAVFVPPATGGVVFALVGISWIVFSLDTVTDVAVRANGDLGLRCLLWTASYGAGTSWRWRRRRLGGLVAGYLVVRRKGKTIPWIYVVAGRMPDADRLREFASGRSGTDLGST